MQTLHYKAGYTSAKRGEWRTAPKHLKIITAPWREWYAGFDAATTADNNCKLDAQFNLRKASTVYTAEIN